MAHELTHVVQQLSVNNHKTLQREKLLNETDNPEAVISAPDTPKADDPEIISLFASTNPGLSKTNLGKWIEKSIAMGWQPGNPIPDFKNPSISFNEKDELVIECVDFRGDNGAFNTAAKILPKNVGAKFWWRQRFSGSMGQFKLDYASNKAYENLKLHEASKDVDFEALLKISGDLSDYREVMAIKAYSDKLLSEALVRMVAMAQQKLYPDNHEKQTGILDNQTAIDIKSKISEENIKKVPEDAPKENNITPEIPTGPIHDVLKTQIEKLKESINRNYSGS